MQNGKKSKLGSILLGIGAVCVVLRTVPLGGTVRLRTRTGLGKAVRLAGRKTGNAEFDQTFVIASDSDEEMQRVLSASMCERLLAVQQCIGKGWICLLSDGRSASWRIRAAACSTERAAARKRCGRNIPGP